MGNKKRILGLFLIAALFAGASVFGFWWQGEARHGKYRDILPAFYVMGFVKLNYYQPVALSDLMKSYWRTGTISGMLKTLHDPYTRYLDRFEYSELLRDTEGSFSGIGIFLVIKNNKLIVSGVVSGSPCEKAGVRQGDEILKINGVSGGIWDMKKVVSKIRGNVGSELELTVSRNEGAGSRVFSVKMARASITVSTVDLKIKKDPTLGSYAMLRIYQFADTTPLDLEKALARIDLRTDCRGLILDLRANPGGSLEAAIKVASYFLREGTPIIYIKRRGLPSKVMTAERFRHRKLPLVVLVDRESASAAEIVSGALKDQKAAVLVGARTFGKDLIQTVKELPGNTAITVTIASYLTSGKVNIHHKGVQPDRVVEIPGAMERLLKGNPQTYLQMQTLQEQEAVKILNLKVPHLSAASNQ